MTPEEAVGAISPTAEEVRSGVIEPAHLIDDYLRSRNVARFGLKHTTIKELEKQVFPDGGTYFYWHAYLIPIDEKVRQMRDLLGPARKLPDGTYAPAWNLSTAKYGLKL